MSERSSRVTRRGFLEGMGVAAVGIREVGPIAGPNPGSPNSPGAAKANDAAVTGISDGPASPLFAPIPLQGNSTLADLAQAGLSQYLRENLKHAPSGNCVCWGIPFRVEGIALVKEKPLELKWPGIEAAWLVLMHTTDMSSQERNSHGFVASSRGPALLGEKVADYVFLYSDGSEDRGPILRQHQQGMLHKHPFGV